MARYIDADLEILKILKTIKQKQEKNESDKFTDEILLTFINALKNAPTADVQEVKHGKWKVGHLDLYCCNCGEVVDEKKNYCPNCGAKMA